MDKLILKDLKSLVSSSPRRIMFSVFTRAQNPLSLPFWTLATQEFIYISVLITPSRGIRRTIFSTSSDTAF